MASQIFSGNWEKLDQPPAAPIHRGMVTIKVWRHLMQNPLSKTP
jgi:hypothetical protein